MLSTEPRTAQLVIAASQLTSLAGQYISSISFRLPQSREPWPPNDASFSNFDVLLSNGVNPSSSSQNFSNNVIGPQTIVKTGPLVIPTASFTSVGHPNNFTFNINFATPYLYQANTNLVIQFNISGQNSSEVSLDAVTVNASGYGNLFIYYFQNSFGQSNAFFPFIKINSRNPLGVNSVEIGGNMSIYHNPASDHLFVKNVGKLKYFEIFSLTGQKLKSGDVETDPSKINITGLHRGNYILKVTDSKGNTSSQAFIKE